MSSVPYKYESFDKYTKRVELQQREAAKRQAIVDAERKIARAAARAKAATPEGIAEARAKSEAIAKGTARLQARLKKRAEKKRAHVMNMNPSEKHNYNTK
jgi:ParB-like chromosome segregation protein Spo0J